MTSQKKMTSFGAEDAQKRTGVMTQLAGDSDMRAKRLADHLDGVLKKLVSEVLVELSENLRGRMTNLESTFAGLGAGVSRGHSVVSRRDMEKRCFAEWRRKTRLS